MKADLHNHLRTSSNRKKNDFNKAVDTTFKRLGRNSLIGMVNFEDRRYEKFTRQIGRYDRTELDGAVYIPEKDVTIVKGQEIPTKQGHLLALGLPHGTNLDSGREIKDTIKEVKDNNGIIILDHPFYFEGAGEYIRKNLSLLEDVDAIEVYNGTCSFGFPIGPLNSDANKKALVFFEEYSSVMNFGGIVTSDGHSFYEVGRSYSELEDISKENLNDSLKKAIRNHKNFDKDRKGSIYGKIGAVDHILDLVCLIGADKILSRAKEDSKR